MSKKRGKISAIPCCMLGSFGISAEAVDVADDKGRAKSEQAKRPPGRPKGSIKRAGGSKIITLYVTEADKDYIADCAATRNVSMNDYLQGLIDKDKQRV